MKLDILILQEKPLRSDFPFGVTSDGVLDFYESGGTYLPDIYLSDRETFGDSERWRIVDKENIPVPSVVFMEKGGADSVYILSGNQISRSNVSKVLTDFERIDLIDGKYYLNNKPLNTNGKNGLIRVVSLPNWFPAFPSIFRGAGLPVVIIAGIIVYLLSKTKKK